MKIPFNKPFLTGNETKYIEDAVNSGKISGNGKYTKKCQQFFEDRFDIGKALLTTSCTDALEMTALLLDIQPGDEVIMPSYTFVSTANAFVLRGAVIRFCDSRKDHPGMDEDTIEDLITTKTKVIVPVHYAGVACDMEKIMHIAEKHNLFVVEDAAQAIDAYYTFSDGTQKALGSIGHLAAFSFHETKNIIAGEGGLLAINDDRFSKRAEIIWEKGTNRAAFMRGEVNKYNWVDVGSSFLPSEVVAAFLWAQLEEMESIQQKRKALWNTYYDAIEGSEVQLPQIPDYATNNGHLFYVICQSQQHRDQLIETFAKNEIWVVFHYLCLHESPFYKGKYEGPELSEAKKYSERLLRLPLFYELSTSEVNSIVQLLQ